VRTIEVIGGGPAGLFAARLIRQRFPSAAVRVSERTVPDETFGFGVGFTQRTLSAVRAADPSVFDAIVAASVPAPGQEMRIGGLSARATAPTGAMAIARSRLLSILLDAAREVGVVVELGRERGLDEVAHADLVIAADGARSGIRTALDEYFEASVEPGRGMFMWLGCDARLDSNLFAAVTTEHGLFDIHAYPYDVDRSTIGVEADADTWRRAGMEGYTAQTPLTETDHASIAYLQRAFGPVLGGATLLGNRSRWMNFTVVSAKRWHHGNVVLIGDAAHTAHYSVGSGTKMALEDAIALADRLADRPLETALAEYEALRRPRVEALQATALRSQHWWESFSTRVDLGPARLMLAYLSRGGVVPAGRLVDREPELLTDGLAAYAGTLPPSTMDDVVAWTLAQPLKHPRLCALTRVFTGEASTVDFDVTDPWGPDADAIVARCREGAGVLRVTGAPSREALIDRLAVCERIVRETERLVVAVGRAGDEEDLADALIAGRAHLIQIIPVTEYEEPPMSRPLTGVVPYPREFAERYRAAGFWQPGSIPRRLRDVVQAHADRRALVTLAGTLTYAELDARSDAVAAGLLDLGLQPGERVLLQVTNSEATVLLWYGLLKAGLIPVCTLAIHRRHEIADIGRQTGAAAHVVQADFRGFDLVGLAEQMVAELDDLRTIVTVGASEHGYPRVEALTQCAITAPEHARLMAVAGGLDEEDVAVLQLSGGTTGTPKVIPRLHAEYWYNARATSDWWGHGPDSVLAVAAPIVHNAGSSNALHAAHAVGATLLLGLPPADIILPMMAEHGATWTVTPPGIVDDYLSHPRFDDAVARVHSWMLSGAKVPTTVFEELTARGIQVTQAFGMSEGLFSFTPLDSSADVRAQTLGRPISPLDEVRVLVPDTEEEVPVGEVGELAARGPYTIRGYLAAPERNAEAFTSDGFYRSGDLIRKVVIDGQEWITLAGRVKDLINRGGEKINAEEVEGLLARLPSIVEVAVVAMPDARLGERACAYVVPADHGDPPSLDDLIHHLDRLGVAKYKWPERLELIDRLPRTQIGKVTKFTLRDDIRQRMGLHGTA
jgi:2,3-dihydroxybenzoate-AMP ligase